MDGVRLAKQVWQGTDSSTLLLTILTLVSLSVIYLQHRGILPSPYSNLLKLPPQKDDVHSSRSKESTARCRECSELKPISKLKICSNCKITPTSPSSSIPNPTELNFYYCDTTCQKLNWKTHKLICGSFKNLASTSTVSQTEPGSSNAPSSNPDSLTLPPSNLFNPDLEKWKTEIEALLKQWCNYHRNLLIFATIHGLDLLRNPKNATQILLMISLNLNGDEKKLSHEKMIELTSAADKKYKALDSADGVEKKKQNDSNIHDLFSVAHIGSLDSSNFFNSNPGMLNACQEMEKVRVRVSQKGGVGAAMLLVRYGAIVHVIPVGLPSQADLDAVPRQKNWREIFDEAIKTGLPWNPPS